MDQWTFNAEDLDIARKTHKTAIKVAKDGYCPSGVLMNRPGGVSCWICIHTAQAIASTRLETKEIEKQKVWQSGYDSGVHDGINGYDTENPYSKDSK